MIKIAIISDIHANSLALDKVLNDIKEFNPDKIFCLGDLILGGFDANYVVSKIIELKEKMGDNFQIIQGNTDKMVAQAYYGDVDLIEKTKTAFRCMGYSLEQDIKETDKRYIDFVKDLPEKTSVEINGIKIELVHGSPRNQSENIFPEMPTEVVEEMVKDSSSDVILCGHTHKPCGYSLNSGKTVINVGSVGRTMMDNDRRAVYLQMTIDDMGKFFVEHRLIEYDNKLASQKIIERGFPYCEELAKMYV